MNIDSTVIVEDVEANSDDYVQMGWLKHQEVLVLILEDELVNKWVLFQAFQSFLQLFHVEMAASIR